MVPYFIKVGKGLSVLVLEHPALKVQPPVFTCERVTIEIPDFNTFLNTTIKSIRASARSLLVCRSATPLGGLGLSDIAEHGCAKNPGSDCNEETECCDSTYR